MALKENREIWVRMEKTADEVSRAKEEQPENQEMGEKEDLKDIRAIEDLQESLGNLDLMESWA